MSKTIRREQHLRWLVVSLWLLASALTVSVSAQSSPSSTTATERQLQDLQSQINVRQGRLQKHLRQAQDMQDRLREAELGIAELAQKIAVSERRIKDNQLQQDRLIKRQNTLQKSKVLQQQALAKQIRSAYLRGDNDYTKMLLNQDDPGKFERMLVYYRYLNQARLTAIADFQSLVVELSTVATKLKTSIEQMQQKSTQLQSQQAQMQQRQQQRQATLIELQSTINSEAANIEQLQINEQNLVQTMETARAELARVDRELLGLKPYRGQLQPPAEGRKLAKFGQRRQGQVRWKGILFYGNAGDPVSAVHHGKVLFADWLRGFGLMLIVDHGAGYMSLYGHNQALLKQAGDTVSEGESIALLGQSGGQARPSLYFEIRHKGRPVDPAKWLAK